MKKKKLVIAEKPAAGKDIARILKVTENKYGYYENDEYIVTWAVGHLVELRDPDDLDERYKKWDIEDLPLPWDNGLKVKPSGRDQFKVIKSLINRNDIEYIINAGDAGREGLLIQNWIYKVAGNRHPVKVLWASSLTDQAINEAMNRLHDGSEQEFVNLYREAEARAFADQIYGYNYTRLLTILFRPPGQKGVLSYGRCQTPLLNLIYERDIENENFKPQSYQEIEIIYTGAFGFKGVLISEDGKIKKFTDKDEAEALVHNLSQCKAGTVKEVQKEHKKEKAPSLLNLAQLQTIMGKKYGLEPAKTLEIAQRLYETHKILSYPRTDSRYLTNDLYEEIGEHVKACSFGKFEDIVNKIDLSTHSRDKSYYNDNKVADHHALIPTIGSDMKNNYGKLSDEEKNCMDEVIVSFLSIFYPPYEYDSTRLLMETAQGCLFLSQGSMITSLGYKVVTGILKVKEGIKEVEEAVIPDLKEGQKVPIEGFKLKEGKTKPKPKYGPGNIIKLMEKYKIGTPATSAGIVKTLLDRGFVELKNKNYTTTSLGRQLIKLIPPVLKAPEFTYIFEEKLKKVNSGELQKERFLEDIIESVNNNKTRFIESSRGCAIKMKSIGKCPLCNRELIPSPSNWFCPGYNEKDKCNFKLWKIINEKQLSDNDLEDLLAKGKTRMISGFVSKKGAKFQASLILEKDGKVTFSFPKGKR